MNYIGQQLLIPHLAGNILPYTLNFAVRSFETAWTAPNWAVSAGTAKNTPTPGIELVTNGNMETGSPPSDWSSVSSGLLTAQADERTGGIGLQCLQIENGAGSAGRARQSLGGSIGDWIHFSGWGKSGTTNAVLQHSASAGASLKLLVLSTGGWASNSFVSRRIAAGELIDLINANGTLGRTSRFDDISAKALSSLLSYRNFNAANVQVKAPWTITANHQAGVVARVSADGSQYLLAYHDRTNAYLVKVLSIGTTQLIAAAAAYADGRNVEIRCNGNTIQLFYNNVQIGTDQTETTLSVNTRHGLFSTDVSNTVPSFSVVKN